MQNLQALASPTMLGIARRTANDADPQRLAPHTVVCGEVGLAGEIRAVGQMELRLREAERLWFKVLLMPAANRVRLEKKDSTLLVIGVQTIQDVAACIFQP